MKKSWEYQQRDRKNQTNLGTEEHNKWTKKLEGFSSRFEQTEERICELKDKPFESILSEEQNKKRKRKNKESLKGLWDKPRD